MLWNKFTKDELLKILYENSNFYKNIKNASIILVGSSTKRIRRKLTDIDLRFVIDQENDFLMATREVVRTEVSGTGIFCRTIYKPEIESLRGPLLSMFLWHIDPPTFLRDDEGKGSKLVAKTKRRFERELKDEIMYAYIIFRSHRNQLHSAKGKNLVTISLLKSDICRKSMELYSLIHGEPFPYTKWLVDHTRKLSKKYCEEEIFIKINDVQGNGKNSYDSIEDLKSYFDKSVVSIFNNNDLIEKWWKYLTLKSF